MINPERFYYGMAALHISENRAVNAGVIQCSISDQFRPVISSSATVGAAALTWIKNNVSISFQLQLDFPRMLQMHH